MSQASDLLFYLGSPVLGVAATYHGATDVYICGVEVNPDNTLSLVLPKGHVLETGDKVTIHLDNRTGVDEYDAELKVYRCSYKGEVTHTSKTQVQVSPIEFELYYGVTVVCQYARSGYQHPTDNRTDKPLPVTPLVGFPIPDLEDAENKVGVLITQAVSQPHTTVMAFLSSKDDDIFFITFPETFKSKLLKKNNHCHFAIDSRAFFTYEHAIEWNYTIIEADAYQIPREHPLFEPIKESFIEKNPWEAGFFSHPQVEMYHLTPIKLICPKQAEDGS